MTAARTYTIRKAQDRPVRPAFLEDLNPAQREAATAPDGPVLIIAGAGMAAALPGVVAAKTPLPVLGVPMETRVMGGMDSLLSMVQMPGGIPVGTLAVRSEEHTSELQSHLNLVCRLLLEKKKNKI